MMAEKLKALAAAALFALAPLASGAWPLWDDFKGACVTDGGRVVDYSDPRQITTSEGQSYAMFFAIVANDREAFGKLAAWTEANLSGGSLEKALPSWLWGQSDKRWRVIDSNNAVDSDMWIAYSFLEAARLWNAPEYKKKGLAMLSLLRNEVRRVENLGSVLLPGRDGFEKDGVITLNPSYSPLFLIKRFALEDDYWNEVYEGSVRAVLRSSPSGIAPDWAKFDAKGKLLPPQGEDYEIGSYNAIRTYLWAGMMEPTGAVCETLKGHFEPMVKATEALNFPPEKIHVVTGDVNHAGSDGFGACLLPLLEGKTAALIRTVLGARKMDRESYYSNVLTLFGLGFDSGLFAFDADGRVTFPNNPDWSQKAK